MMEARNLQCTWFIAILVHLTYSPLMRPMPTMFTRRILTLALVASLPSIASAHPGHGSVPPNSPQHYLLSLEHAAPIIAVGLIAAIIAAGFAVGRARLLSIATTQSATLKAQ